MTNARLSLARARALAFAGGLATGLACGFGIAATVIGFAGTSNWELSVARSQERPPAAFLQSLPADRRSTLVAQGGDDDLVFDIHLQGERETVFLDFGA